MRFTLGKNDKGGMDMHLDMTLDTGDRKNSIEFWKDIKEMAEMSIEELTKELNQHEK